MSGKNSWFQMESLENRPTLLAAITAAITIYIEAEQGATPIPVEERPVQALSPWKIAGRWQNMESRSNFRTSPLQRGASMRTANRRPVRLRRIKELKYGC